MLFLVAALVFSLSFKLNLRVSVHMFRLKRSLLRSQMCSLWIAQLRFVVIFTVSFMIWWNFSRLGVMCRRQITFLWYVCMYVRTSTIIFWNWITIFSTYLFLSGISSLNWMSGRETLLIGATIVLKYSPSFYF